MASQIRQNFNYKTENFIIKQINMLINSAYTYLSMSTYFDRYDVAQPGLSQFFKKCSNQDLEQAETLIKYTSKRGGSVLLDDIKLHDIDWTNALEVLEIALGIVKKLNKSLLDLHQLASSCNDPHLTSFLESNLLNKKVELMRLLGVFITKFKRDGPTGLAEYLLDQNIENGLVIE